MSITNYILKSLSFYKKQNLAVFFAILLSTAVLTGAMIVGDSVKLSLKSLVEKRLGKVSYALVTGDRFVRAELSKDISDDLGIKTSSVLMVEGISINSGENKRVNKTTILGIDESFWQISDKKVFKIKDNEAVIGINLAEKLKLKPGDEFLLRIATPQLIPLDAPFASDDGTDMAMRLTVKAIADNNQLARFSLKNDQKPPFNVFVNRTFLAGKLEFPEKINLVLVPGDTIPQEKLTKSLQNNWTFEDANLKLRTLKNKEQYELISERIFIDKAISEKIEQLQLDITNHITYLVNFIEHKQKSTPYSFVTARNAIPNLKENEIVINQWLADDLNAQAGDTVNLKYFVVGRLKKLEEKERKFLVKGIISTENNLIDSFLMPEFPGMTEAGNCRDWETGVPIDMKKIRDKDEAYWDKFRGKPKAVISSKAGNEIWTNEFGNYTNIRFKENQIPKAELEEKLLTKLKAEDLGIEFYSVRQSGKRAADNGIDFGELFLSLSFFVIAAAIILLVIILKFNTESRSKEFGVLTGLGFSKGQILKIKTLEISFIALFASVFGALAGILYNSVLLVGLNSVWYDAVKTDMLEMFVLPKTLIIGTVSGFIISVLVIFLVIRKKLKTTIVRQITSTENKKGNFVKIAFYSLSVISIGLLSYLFTLPVEQNSSLFLTTGFLLLVSFVLGFLVYVYSLSAKAGVMNMNLFGLSLKNLSSNKARSVSVVLLLALGTFTIIVTASNRKTFHESEEEVSSGTGGYLFWAETTMPLLHNLNSPQGKAEYNIENGKQLSFLQFYKLSGDDASCLNLNQVSNPAILGVNYKKLAERKAFSFAQFVEDETPSWNILEKELGENIIPAIADQTVITWGLIKSIGDTLTYLDENGKELKIVLVGGLNASVFQGNLLISAMNFRKHFPSVSGSKVMLIDGDFDMKRTIEKNLSEKLIDKGIEITSTSRRLSEFYSVTNTYLTVFMILGSLGVLLATIGMGIVILRTILERKYELGLMLALGFGKKRIFLLLMLENSILLFVGLGIGVLSAFAGVIPSILSNSFSASQTYVFIVLLTVLVNGLFWIFLASKSAAKGRLIQNLKTE